MKTHFCPRATPRGLLAYRLRRSGLGIESASFLRCERPEGSDCFDPKTLRASSSPAPPPSLPRPDRPCLPGSRQWQSRELVSHRRSPPLARLFDPNVVWRIGPVPIHVLPPGLRRRRSGLPEPQQLEDAWRLSSELPSLRHGFDALELFDGNDSKGGYGPWTADGKSGWKFIGQVAPYSRRLKAAVEHDQKWMNPCRLRNHSRSRRA